MKPGPVTRSVLFVGGVVALWIGGNILTNPHAFYATYGIDLAGSASLASELRAAGGSVLAAGVVVLTGAFVARLVPVAAAVGALVYLAYALSRGLSILLDGLPDSGIILSAWVELGVGLACLTVLLRSLSAKP